MPGQDHAGHPRALGAAQERPEVVRIRDPGHHEEEGDPPPGSGQVLERDGDQGRAQATTPWGVSVRAARSRRPRDTISTRTLAGRPTARSRPAAVPAPVVGHPEATGRCALGRAARARPSCPRSDPPRARRIHDGVACHGRRRIPGPRSARTTCAPAGTTLDRLAPGRPLPRPAPRAGCPRPAVLPPLAPPLDRRPGSAMRSGLRRRARPSSTTESAAMPPVSAPRPSGRVALIETSPPTTSHNRRAISAVWGASRGRSRDHGAVGVDHRPPVAAGHVDDRQEQPEAVGAGPARVGVGEVAAEVARPIAPRMASARAWVTTSASLCPRDRGTRGWSPRRGRGAGRGRRRTDGMSKPWPMRSDIRSCGPAGTRRRRDRRAR